MMTGAANPIAVPVSYSSLPSQEENEAQKKGTGPICVKHPPGHSGKLDLSPFSLHATAWEARRRLTMSLFRYLIECATGHGERDLGKSCSDESDLALALGVIGNALRSLPNPRALRVLAGDTAVACAKNVFCPEQIELGGGGGTDMAAMVVAACEERPSPKAILAVTDGYTGWPPKPVGPRVVACLTQPQTAEGVPRWIDTVVLNPDN